MKTILDCIKSFYPSSREDEIQHLESLIKDLVHKQKRIQYGKGYEDGLKRGRELESSMWRGFAPNDLKDLIEGKDKDD